MAGMLEVSDVGRWDRPGTALIDGEVPPTYLEGVQGQDGPQADSGHEDRQISHDAETMLGWISEKTHHNSWRLFTGFGQRLYVANANADTAEATHGVVNFRHIHASVNRQLAAVLSPITNAE